MVADAKAQIENLTPDQVEAEVADGALLVDIREPGEREAGHIPGTLHAVRGMIEFYADPSMANYHKPELAMGKRIILHCASGGRSALAAATLKEMGHDVAHLDGGFGAWKDAGKPVA